MRETRLLLRQPKSENSRWSDAEIASYLNDGIQKYFLHINEVGEGQFDKTVDLDLVANTETVALPTDFYSVKALYRKQGTARQILRYNNNIIGSYDTTGASGTSYTPQYYFRVNNLVLRPIPGASETGGLVLEYTSFPEVLLYGGDSLTAGISPLFKELCVVYAAYKCKITDDSTSSGNQTRQALKEHLSDLFEQFKHQVVERSKYPNFITPFNP